MQNLKICAFSEIAAGAPTSQAVGKSLHREHGGSGIPLPQVGDEALARYLCSLKPTSRNPKAEFPLEN
jgi:hypothetical protein